MKYETLGEKELYTALLLSGEMKGYATLLCELLEAEYEKKKKRTEK